MRHHAWKMLQASLSNQWADAIYPETGHLRLSMPTDGPIERDMSLALGMLLYADHECATHCSTSTPPQTARGISINRIKAERVVTTRLLCVSSY